MYLVIVTRYFPSLSTFLNFAVQPFFLREDSECLHCSFSFAFASSSFYWMRPLQSAFSFPLRCTVFLLNADIRLLCPFCLLLCAVFLLNAAVFADRALYLAVGGLALVGLSCSLTTLAFLLLEICNIAPGACAAVYSRSASFHPATELRSARGRASICSGPCCESSSGPSVIPSHLV